MIQRVGILLALVACATAQSSANITFTLFATDFTDCDSTSACDLKVKIKCASSASDWHDCGETSKLQDDNFPVWPEYFNFLHEQNTGQRWRFDLIDEDVAFDDTIATFNVIVDEYATNMGNLFQLPMPDNKAGILWVHRRFPPGGMN